MAFAQAIPSPFYRVSVKALVFDDTGRLLVVREHVDAWEIPGGGWEHGETLEQCLARELAEELHATLGSCDPAPLTVCAASGRMKLLVRATLGPGEPAPGAEMTALDWVTRERFTTLPMHVGDEIMRAPVLARWPG